MKLCASYGLAFVISMFLMGAGCDDDYDTGSNSNHYEYFEDVPITELLIADTIYADDSIGIVYKYPEGCNNLNTAEYTQSQDTLIFNVNLRFYYFGIPCAHGPGVDTAYATVNLNQSMMHYGMYRNQSDSTVIIPFYYLMR